MLGGTFDPVHRGHVASAIEVADALALDRVLLVVSARPPHKPGGARASADHRLAMTALAARADARLEACGLELERSGPSFTVDTLSVLAARHPESRVTLIVGIDAFEEIATWKQAERLFEYADIVVTTRPGHGWEAGRLEWPFAASDDGRYDPAIAGYVHRHGSTLTSIELAGVEVSASEVRGRLEAGRPVDDLVGADVAAYIAKHQLYGARPH